MSTSRYAISSIPKIFVSFWFVLFICRPDNVSVSIFINSIECSIRNGHRSFHCKLPTFFAFKFLRIEMFFLLISEKIVKDANSALQFYKNKKMKKKNPMTDTESIRIEIWSSLTCVSLIYLSCLSLSPLFIEAWRTRCLTALFFLIQITREKRDREENGEECENFKGTEKSGVR